MVLIKCPFCNKEFETDVYTYDCPNCKKNFQYYPTTIEEINESNRKLFNTMEG